MARTDALPERKMRLMRLAFVWHWSKRADPQRNGALAITDGRLKAVERLTAEGEEAVVFALAKPPHANTHFFCKDQRVRYNLVPDRARLLEELTRFRPEAVFLHHHRGNYDDLLEGVAAPAAKRAIFYCSTITYHPITMSFDAFVVDHQFQADALADLGVDPSKIHLAPANINLDSFRPVAGTTKRWDCIYPARGGFGSLKRIELAVEASRMAGVTLCLPGANIPCTLNQTPERGQRVVSRWAPWLWRRAAPIVRGLQQYPHVTSLPWLSQEQLCDCYNQSRCLVTTSNDREMGPRIIPEAAACNLPFVCCSDCRAAVSHAKRMGGFIADPNPRDIAAKIRHALASKPNTRKRLLDAGLDTWVIYRVVRRLLDEWTK